MGIKSFYASVVSPILRNSELGERIAMGLVAFNAKLQFANFVYADSGSKIFSDSEIDELFADLDSSSREIAKRFMHHQHKIPPQGFMIHPDYFYTAAENSEYRKLLKDFTRSIRRFKLKRHLVGPESLYYHHGLRFAPEFVKKSIAGKVFADVGGWLGDSALVFAGYSPAKIAVFEPEQAVRIKLENTLKRNRIPGTLYHLHPWGLSDTHTVSDGFECRTLDEIAAEYSAPFGVLKADIEGMGTAFLRGAERTVKRDRPLLSLAIYHNEDEFTGIYQLLKSWDLGYHIEIQSLNPLTPHNEVTLFAYPGEWAQMS